MSEAEIAAAARAIPLGRIAPPTALPRDIARAAMFLASDDVRRATGQTWHVNGGPYLTRGTPSRPAFLDAG